MSDEITLRVNGQIYGGWKTASITRSMRALCASFKMDFSDRWLAQEKAWPILPGDECSFYVGDDLALEGYVDDFEPSASATERRMSVTGRDKTADLVDCSVEQTKTWRNIDLKRYAELLSEPFGLNVSSEASLGTKFLSLTPNAGESPYDALEKAARQRGVLVLSDASDAVLLTKSGVGKSSSRLVQGENLLEIKVGFSHKERYSKYQVKSQMGGFENLKLEQAFGVTATVTDPGVSRYRPHVVMAEVAGDPAAARRRAIWERNTRLGKSAPVTAVAQGFRQKDGRLWTINELVPVVAPWVGIDQELLITGVSMSKSEQGTITTLELMMKEAFDVLVEVPKKDLLANLVARSSK